MDSSNSSSSSSTETNLLSPIVLLSNICNLISIKLDSTNYVLWKFQLTTLLKAHKLFGFIDGTQPCPISNPSYDDWFAKDQALMTVINATLSPEALAYVVGSTTSKQVWNVLAKLYSSSSRSNVVNLKSDLQTISKKSDESIDAYIKRIKEIKDKLANVSTVVNDEDLLIYALNGLPTEYNTFRTSMRTRSTPVTFEELHVLLKAEESALAKQSKRDDLCKQPTALLASSQSLMSYASTFNNNFVRGRGRGRGHGHGCSSFDTQGRGGGSSQQQQLVVANNHSSCQICLRRGHIALDCFNRMNYNFHGRHPPHHLAAMVASQNNAFLSIVNSDMNYLSLASGYHGEEQVGVGSGQSLPISHSGQEMEQNFVPKN
ncbi:Retrovirus-related Pol polyprotein from transposon RE1, partial [Cucurbita argyrosperma subsp. sororia]